MLLLTRRVGQKIRIGDDIVVQVCETRGSQVRIGVTAPRETRVLREELCRENEVVEREFAKPRRVEP